MKHIIFILFFAALVAGIASCSKDKTDNKKTLVSSPEATAENDAKSGGVYKGVIIGSSGTIKIILQKNTLAAEVTIDGVTKVLESTSLVSWATGQAIVNAVFQKDDWVVTFSVNADGSEPEVEVEIPGHSHIEVTIVKELSDVLVRAFEGTYTVTNGQVGGSGTWNFVSVGDSLAGIRKANDGGEVVGMYGTIDEDAIEVFTGSASATGTYNGNDASGTWTDIGASGTWTGKRTL